MKLYSALNFLVLLTTVVAYPNELPASDSPERTQACCYKKNGDVSGPNILVA
jgi:hypothetical protein